MGAASAGCRCTCSRETGAREGDVIRLDEEGLLEVPDDSQEVVRPQVLKSELVPDGVEFGDIWPENWGMTVGQFRDLIEECKQEPKWSASTTMSELVKDYVVPRTEGKGVGYALSCNTWKPKRVNVLVSNCFQEKAELLCERLERSVRKDDGLFITALALYQAEDGAGPSIGQQLGGVAELSPFTRVLRDIQVRGKSRTGVVTALWRLFWVLQMAPAVLAVLGLFFIALPTLSTGCLPVPNQCAFGSANSAKSMSWRRPLVVWTWTLVVLDGKSAFLMWLGIVFLFMAVLAWTVMLFRPVFDGRMLAVTNHRCDPYCTEEDPGACVVKMEIFTARCMGIPVRMASAMAPPPDLDSRGGLAGSGDRCCTKQDTAFFVDEETLEYRGKVNAAARRALEKAKLEAGVAEVLWMNALFVSNACFLRLLAVGFQPQLDESRSVFRGIGGQAIWGWNLIAGNVIGGMAVAGVIAYTVVSARGRTTTRGWCVTVAIMTTVALVLFFVQSLLRLLSQFRGAPDHGTSVLDLGCLLCGVALGLLQGVFAILCILAVWRDGGKFVRALEKRKVVLWVLGILAVVAFSVASSSSWRVDQLLPTLIFVSLATFGMVVGPALALWSTLAYWGVTLDHNVG